MQREQNVAFWRLGTKEAQALVVRRVLPMKKCWLYVPGGPLGEGEQLLGQMRELGERERAVFVRIEPVGSFDSAQGKWRKSDYDIQPRHSLLLHLNQSEEELQAAMHQKTRYNIRLAQKRGVTVRFSRDDHDLDRFLKLAREVEQRGTFHYHPADYYRSQLKILRQDAKMEVAVAEYRGSVLAVNLLIVFGDTMTYLHGASSADSRDLMGPHLLQWESVKRAKELGLARYDFWGVAPPKADDNHSWSGITRFKEGFGGERVMYPGAYDIVMDHFWYLLYSTIRSWRR